MRFIVIKTFKSTLAFETSFKKSAGTKLTWFGNCTTVFVTKRMIWRNRPESNAINLFSNKKLFTVANEANSPDQMEAIIINKMA